MAIKSPEWKQVGPLDQSIVLLSNIEGTILNCVDGCFPIGELEGKVLPMIEELRKLHLWFPEKWGTSEGL
jgi:hypothetical protein